MFDVTLDKKTAYDIYVIAETCLNVRTLDGFSKDVIDQTKHILGQEMTACGIGDANTAKIVSILNAGFPDAFLASAIDADECFKSPLCQRWLNMRAPQAVELGRHGSSLPGNEAELYNEFEISNVLSHGMLDLDRRYASYFGFAQIQERVESHHLYLMSFMVPHLHVAYARIHHAQRNAGLPVVANSNVSKTELYSFDRSGDSSVKSRKKLSARELEVLQWLLTGKSNWDIGKILNISEYTVKNHVQHIMKKLNANSRQHAVAKALEEGLIKL